MKHNLIIKYLLNIHQSINPFTACIAENRIIYILSIGTIFHFVLLENFILIVNLRKAIEVNVQFSTVLLEWLVEINVSSNHSISVTSVTRRDLALI